MSENKFDMIRAHDVKLGDDLGASIKRRVFLEGSRRLINSLTVTATFCLEISLISLSAAPIKNTRSTA